VKEIWFTQAGPLRLAVTDDDVYPFEVGIVSRGGVVEYIGIDELEAKWLSSELLAAVQQYYKYKRTKESSGC
jgi:hypothetical protein